VHMRFFWALVVGGVVLGRPALAGQTKEVSHQGSATYDDFEPPEFCGACHQDVFQQWQGSAMARSFTMDWDQAEYFELALPHSRIDPKLASVKSDCIRCHSPEAFLAGDIPPKRARENTPANRGVSCEVCHGITGIEGAQPFNGNYVLTLDNVEFGPRGDAVAPAHETQFKDIFTTARYCADCHDERDPYGVWVKATYQEWQAGPYGKAGLACQRCHMPSSPGVSAVGGRERPDVAQHFFMGGNSQAKLRGAVEIAVYPQKENVRPGDELEIKVAVINAKPGHMFPTGSTEERQLWLTLEAVASDGSRTRIPAQLAPADNPTKRYSLTSNQLAYQDMGVMMGKPDFPGVAREALPEGDRIYRMMFLDPQGRPTIAQWNCASQPFDNRLKPLESRTEVYKWTVPAGTQGGSLTLRATLCYRKLPQSVADLFGLGEIPIVEVAAAEADIMVK
jgi:nitrate/TMAO reductase-like tetraheme cytochrome c subunit